MKSHHLLAALAALSLSVFSVGCERAGDEKSTEGERRSGEPSKPDRSDPSQPSQPSQPGQPAQPGQPNP